jgi:hypothetical protein
VAARTLEERSADETSRAFGSTEDGDDVSTMASSHQRDLVAGFLCAFSLALSGIALVRNPGLLSCVAIVVALVALRMSETRQRLAAVAVAVGGLAFFFGMVIAVVTAHPLY